jgi:hypothetical protein
MQQVYRLYTQTPMNCDRKADILSPGLSPDDNIYVTQNETFLITVEHGQSLSVYKFE